VAGYDGGTITSVTRIGNLFSGKGHANIRAKQDEEQQAYFAYQKAVLGAVQDCEDALVHQRRNARAGSQ
jgi:outer membrane protein TolC